VGNELSDILTQAIVCIHLAKNLSIIQVYICPCIQVVNIGLEPHPPMAHQVVQLYVFNTLSVVLYITNHLAGVAIAFL